MSRIQIKKEIKHGELIGNGVKCKCRVEVATQLMGEISLDRTLDIWVQDPLPEGNYTLLLVDGETVSMRYTRGSWQEVKV
jgi:hypothetical protein